MFIRGTLLLLLINIQLASGQDFAGYSSSNYTGVNGVIFNPSGIANSRTRWDVNILSLHAAAENNIGVLNFRNYQGLYKGNELVNQYKSATTLTHGYGNLNIIGPSVMLRLNPVSSLAITTRARTMVNARNVNTRFVEEISSRVSNSANLPWTFLEGENMAVNVNSWAELGLTYATVLKDDGMQQMKVGATLKYLAGMVNGYMQTSGITGTMAHDALQNASYFENTTGSLRTGYGGVVLGNFTPSNVLRYRSHGTGVDLGFTYIFQPNDGYDDSKNWFGASEPLYKFRLGVSLLDVGFIRYRSNDGNRFDVDISGTERLYTEELRRLRPNEFETYFESHPAHFVSVSGRIPYYNVMLPASLRVDADYHVDGAIYVNLMGQFGLIQNDKQPWGQHSYHSLTFTPRIENRFWGVYMPLNYNQLSKFNAGLSLRAGYFFVGSGSVLSMLYQSKRLDFHAGIRFSSLDRDEGGGGIWRKTRSRTDCWKD